MSSPRNLVLYFAILLLSLLSVTSALTIPPVDHSDISVIERDAYDAPGMSIDNSHHLMARANPTLCANLTVWLQETVNGQRQNTAIIIPSTCYCVTGGALTSDSDTRLRGYLDVKSTYINQTAFSRYLSTNNLSRPQGVTNIVNAVTAGENGKTTTCTYPANATPVCGDGCPFTCPTNYKVCGNTCISSTTTCTSGRTSRKREATQKVCPTGFAACATGLKGFGGNAAGWECVDVDSDIESCGGCQQPMPGGKVGQDCTAIPGADAVACLSGGCQILRCSRGFQLVDNKCIAIDADTPSSTTEPVSSSKYWAEQLKSTGRPRARGTSTEQRNQRRKLRIKAGDARRKSSRSS